MPPASRVESDSKTTPPRWKKEKDDYKADLSKYPEEIKELCPIVITSIDCRPTRFKDADGKELRVLKEESTARNGTTRLEGASATATRPHRTPWRTTSRT